MAETTEKKAKTPAKPRATAAKKTTAKTKKTEGVAEIRRPSHQEIAALAEQYWRERGHQDGHADQDWLRAEQELMQKAS